jgi:hypothetical protein
MVAEVLEEVLERLASLRSQWSALSSNGVAAIKDG